MMHACKLAALPAASLPIVRSASPKSMAVQGGALTERAPFCIAMSELEVGTFC